MVKWSDLAFQAVTRIVSLPLMPIQAIEPRRPQSPVADRTRSLIAAGKFPPGIRVERRRRTNQVRH
jgi:hypothetical protein